jgi:hypothetical protein
MSLGYWKSPIRHFYDYVCKNIPEISKLILLYMLLYFYMFYSNVSIINEVNVYGFGYFKFCSLDINSVGKKCVLRSTFQI